MSDTSTHERMDQPEIGAEGGFRYSQKIPFDSVEVLLDDADALDKAVRDDITVVVEPEVEHPELGEARSYQLALSIPGATTDLAHDVFLYRRAGRTRRRQKITNDGMPVLVLQNYQGAGNLVEDKWRLTLTKDKSSRLQSSNPISGDDLELLLYGVEVAVARTVYGGALDLAIDKPLEPMNHIGKLALADELVPKHNE